MSFTNSPKNIFWPLLVVTKSSSRLILCKLSVSGLKIQQISLHFMVLSHLCNFFWQNLENNTKTLFKATEVVVKVVSES